MLIETHLVLIIRDYFCYISTQDNEEAGANISVSLMCDKLNKLSRAWALLNIHIIPF